MANNEKGKSLLNEADESIEKTWAKVLLNDEMFEEVLYEFGDEVIARYGSYKNIGKEMIEVILKWLWNKTYNEHMWVVVVRYLFLPLKVVAVAPMRWVQRKKE